ncbi:HECT-domain protein [Trichuris suis]|nr:HECT-domain protein [Trichuris suis]
MPYILVVRMPEYDLDPPRFAQKALDLLFSRWDVMESMIMIGVSEVDRVSRLSEGQFHLFSQDGVTFLDRFMYYLLVKLPIELLDGFLKTLAAKLVKKVNDADFKLVLDRLVRSAVRIFALLNVSPYYMSSRKKCTPISRCRRLFYMLLPHAIRQLASTADGVLALVRSGVVKATLPFSFPSGYDPTALIEKLFMIEPACFPRDGMTVSDKNFHIDPLLDIGQQEMPVLDAASEHDSDSDGGDGTVTRRTGDEAGTSAEPSGQRETETQRERRTEQTNFSDTESDASYRPIDATSADTATRTITTAVKNPTDSGASRADEEQRQSVSSADMLVTLARLFSTLLRETTALLMLALEPSTVVTNIALYPLAMSEETISELEEYVEKRMNATWQWLCPIMDFLESTIRLSKALDLAKRPAGDDSSAKRDHTSANSPQRLEKRNKKVSKTDAPVSSQKQTEVEELRTCYSREAALGYLISVLRLHSCEHGEDVPAMDLASMKHVAIVADALLHSMNSRLHVSNQQNGDAYCSVLYDMNSMDCFECPQSFAPKLTGMLLELPPHQVLLMLSNAQMLRANCQMANDLLMNFLELIGLCLLHNEIMPLPLCRSVFKFILGRPVNWYDLAFYDLTMFDNFYKLARGQFRPEDLHLTFTLTLHSMEGGQTIPLIPNGENIPVTSENVVEYVYNHVTYRLITASLKALENIRDGVHDVLPAAMLDGLTAEDFRLLLTGATEVNTKALEESTIFMDETSANHKKLMQPEKLAQFKRWFWSLVHSMTSEEKQELINFWTGSPALPASPDGPHPVPNVVIRPADDNYLPTANTCISRLYIPFYSSRAVLKQKLMMAIKVDTFGFV